MEIPEEEEEFEGDVRDRFVGDWTVTETSKNLGTRNYSVSMAKDSSFPARVNMDGFYMLPDSEVVIANVSSVEINTITIPGQTLPSAYVSGVGTMEDEVKITFTYTVDDGNDDNSDVSRDTTADTNESRIAPDGSDPISRHVRDADDQEQS